MDESETVLDSEEKESQERIERYQALMLKVLGKQDCEVTKQALRLAMGWELKDYYLEGYRVVGKAFPHMSSLLVNAVKKLEQKDLCNNSSCNEFIEQNMKKTIELRDSLKAVIRLMQDDDIKGLLEYLAGTDEQKADESLLAAYDDVLSGVARIFRPLSFFLATSPPKKGRPNDLSALEKYVEAIIQQYEALSGERFTLDRHRSKDANGDDTCEPITPGHQFVYYAVSYLNEEAKAIGFTKQFTDKNIYNVCERNRSRRRKAANRDKSNA